MRRFRVHVKSDDADGARASLNKVGIPTIGPTYPRITGASGTPRIGDLVVGYPVASSPDEVEAMVREAVGDQQEIGPADALSESD